MHVTIEINGRQALPVRTIPLLTDWRGLSPDQLAQILAGDSDHWPSFDGLTAYRLHPDGSTEPISPRWWASWVVGKLEATSNTIILRTADRSKQLNFLILLQHGSKRHRDRVLTAMFNGVLHFSMLLRYIIQAVAGLSGSGVLFCHICLRR